MYVCAYMCVRKGREGGFRAQRKGAGCEGFSTATRCHFRFPPEVLQVEATIRGLNSHRSDLVITYCEREQGLENRFLLLCRFL